jgi:hypothetical protein
VSDAAIDAMIVALITALPPTIAALFSAWLSSRNARTIAAIHVDINSRMTEFLAAKAQASHAEGKLEGIDHAETKAADAKVADAKAVALAQTPS